MPGLVCTNRAEAVSAGPRQLMMTMTMTMTTTTTTTMAMTTTMKMTMTMTTMMMMHTRTNCADDGRQPRQVRLAIHVHGGREQQVRLRVVKRISHFFWWCRRSDGQVRNSQTRSARDAHAQITHIHARTHAPCRDCRSEWPGKGWSGALAHGELPASCLLRRDGRSHNRASRTCPPWPCDTCPPFR
jgi:hypothetical protein